MEFWKLNGAGNDFILINNIKEKIPEEALPKLTRLLCERRLSIGADGLVAVESAAKGSGADFRMVYYNSDGSLGEMCGNGARCVAYYAYETGLAGESQVIAATAGLVKAERKEKYLYRIRLNDPGVLELDRTFLVNPGKGPLRAAIDSLTGETGRALCIEAGYVEIGDPGLPHLVTLYGKELSALCGSGSLCDADTDVLWQLGSLLRRHPDLYKGANVNFVQVLDENTAYIRTFERGVEDFTYACGTGTGASAAVLTVKGLMSGSGMAFDMAGGRLYMDVEEVDDIEGYSFEVHGLMLTGPVNAVCKGEVTDAGLSRILNNL